MKLSKEIKLEILRINLEALQNVDKRSGIILVDEKTYHLWLEYLISEERYEDCKLLKDNKQFFCKTLS